MHDFSTYDLENQRPRMTLDGHYTNSTAHPENMKTIDRHCQRQKCSP